jgi:hypothetical protein
MTKLSANGTSLNGSTTNAATLDAVGLALRRGSKLKFL